MANQKFRAGPVLTWKERVYVFFRRHCTLPYMLGLLIGFSLTTSLLVFPENPVASYLFVQDSLSGLPMHFNKGNKDKTELQSFAEVFGSSETLYVGLLTATKYFSSRAKACYNTWGKSADGMHLYAHLDSNATLGLPMVNLTDTDDNEYPPQKKSFLMLQHMCDHYIDKYDWFVRADDDVYIKIHELRSFLRKLNKSSKIYLGQAGFGRSQDRERLKLGGANFCMGGPGVIFNRYTLKGLCPHLKQCLEEAETNEEDVELGKCVTKHLSIQCTQSYQLNDLFYHAYKSDYRGTPFNGNLTQDPHFNSSITLHYAKDPVIMHNIHFYTTMEKIHNTKSTISDLHTQISPSSLHIADDKVTPDKLPWESFSTLPMSELSHKTQVIQTAEHHLLTRHNNTRYEYLYILHRHTNTSGREYKVQFIQINVPIPSESTGSVHSERPYSATERKSREKLNKEQSFKVVEVVVREDYSAANISLSRTFEDTQNEEFDGNTTASKTYIFQYIKPASIDQLKTDLEIFRLNNSLSTSTEENSVSENTEKYTDIVVLDQSVPEVLNFQLLSNISDEFNIKFVIISNNSNPVINTLRCVCDQIHNLVTTFENSTVTNLNCSSRNKQYPTVYDNNTQGVSQKSSVNVNNFPFCLSLNKVAVTSDFGDRVNLFTEINEQVYLGMNDNLEHQSSVVCGYSSDIDKLLKDEVLFVNNNHILDTVVEDSRVFKAVDIDVMSQIIP